MRALEVRCIQSGIADVRVAGTLRLAPHNERTRRVFGWLSLEITQHGFNGARGVLAKRALVSGEYAPREETLTAASLMNDALRVLHFGFARGAQSYVEHDGVRYPTTCELQRP